MFRYVAFVWNDADPDARVGARVLAERLRTSSLQWHSVFAAKGLEVFCSDVRPGASEVYLLHGGTGVVVGKLFATSADGGSTAAPLSIGEAETAAVMASAGRRLVERYWGRYVAFLHDSAAGAMWVLRDPSSLLPCFAVRFLGVDVYFSHMEEGARLATGGFSINWKYVAAVLCQTQLQVHATGLNEVSQVLGGECVALRQGVPSRQFYWNLLHIAESERIDDPVAAARLLRDGVRDCVHAWASAYPGIVHLLSGGLDSSIVFACLKDAPARPRLTCLNFHSPGSNSDERDYARLAVAESGCEVVERPRNSDVTLRSMLGAQRACIPFDYYFYLDGGRPEAQVAADCQATAVFSGSGGDQLFYQSRARYAAGDFLARRGLSRALFTVALDAARVDRVSVWNVLGGAVMHGGLRRRWSLSDESGRHQTLIRAGVAHDINRDASLINPWFRSACRAPSGKLWHAYQLLFPPEFYNPLGADSDPEPVAPLFSQPLLALAMRIPTWLLTIGGWDRAMARRAFQHDVPRAITTRRTKGGREEHAKAILVRDMGFARDLLLDGSLVREHILDRAQVTNVLSGRPTRTPAGNPELFGCLSVEAWLRQWEPAARESVK